MRRTLLVVSLFFAAGLSASGCAALKGAVSGDGLAALNEPASIEVSLDRLEDIDESLKQVNTLLFATPIDETSAWTDDLENMSQPVADGVIASARSTPTYQDGARRVMGIKVARMHTANVLANVPQTAKYGSVIEALGAIGGDPGKDVAANLQASYQNLTDVSALESKIEALEDEADREGTVAARKTEIEGELKGIKTEIEGLASKREELRKTLDPSLKNLAGLALSPEDKILMGRLAQVIGHVGRVELQALTALGVLVVQVPMAIPNAHEEAKNLALRWANDALAGAKSLAMESISFDPATLTLKIDGLEDGLAQKIAGDAISFYERAVSAPGRVESIAESVEFQAEMLVAIAETTASLAGASFTDAVGFVVP